MREVIITGSPGNDIYNKVTAYKKKHGEPVAYKVGWTNEDLGIVDGKPVVKIHILSFICEIPVTVKLYYE